MTLFFASLTVLFFLLYLHSYAENKQLNREIEYIIKRVSSGFYRDENGYVLLPSSHTKIRELTAAINRALDTFYLQKADYETSKRMMDSMLTNISHDLRTPLTVLKGYSELLKKEMKSYPVPPKISDMAKKVDEKAEQLVSTINAYFTLSKIQSGDIQIELQKTNITEICHEVILDYYDILEKMQFQTDIFIEPMPAFAQADADTLKRILKNLIDNAVKHGGAGKYLGIRMKSFPEKIMIEIEDHGLGIEEANLEQIFSRNYTTAGKNAGSGLGLTISKSLALKMQGDILVKSMPKKKTVFTLVLNR